MDTKHRKHESIEAKESSPATSGIDKVVDIARATLHLGIGLTAMAIDGMKHIGVEAIHRGAALEKHGRETALKIERESVSSMKEYIKRTREAKKGEASIEAKLEQALADFDVPTREDIRKLHAQLTAFSEKLGKRGAA
jgi:polyhydroxyalkanoate synthesis regulator phasin